MNLLDVYIMNSQKVTGNTQKSEPTSAVELQKSVQWPIRVSLTLTKTIDCSAAEVY